MMLSNLNLSSLPECNFEVRYVDSVLLNPCAEYQRLLRMGKVAKIAANFSEYIANEPKVSYRDGRYFVFDGQNTIEARKTCNGGRDLPIRCKVFYGLSKEHEALLFAVQTGISSELTAGEQLRAKLVAHEENACDFVSVTEDTGVRFALDGIRAPWKIYCIRSAYYIYKSYGAALYREMLSILVDAWDGDSDSPSCRASCMAWLVFWLCIRANTAGNDWFSGCARCIPRPSPGWHRTALATWRTAT